MPKSIHALLPEPRPKCLPVPARGRVDRGRKSVDVGLVYGVTSRLDIESGSIFLLDPDAPELDTTPLIPGIVPALGDYLATVYADASRRLGHRRWAKLILA